MSGPVTAIFWNIAVIDWTFGIRLTVTPMSWNTKVVTRIILQFSAGIVNSPSRQNISPLPSAPHFHMSHWSKRAVIRALEFAFLCMLLSQIRAYLRSQNPPPRSLEYELGNPSFHILYCEAVGYPGINIFHHNLLVTPCGQCVFICWCFSQTGNFMVSWLSRLSHTCARREAQKIAETIGSSYQWTEASHQRQRSGNSNFAVDKTYCGCRLTVIALIFSSRLHPATKENTLKW